MKTLLAAALSLALIGCAGSSPRIDPARLSELQKGQTTVAEVVRQFGRPSVLSKNPDGTQSALYLHSDGPPGTTTMVSLIATNSVDSVTFYFNTNGVLTDYKTTEAKANKPAPADPGVTTQSATSKPRESNASKLNVPSWLPPSTIENR